MEQIALQNVHFGYTEDEVLKGVDLTIPSGELVSIVGENGSGKSTLLKLMLGEIKAQKGKVQLMGKEISKRKSFRSVGYVPQVQSVNQIAFPITVLELVVLNNYEDFGIFKIPRKKHKKRAIEILNEMGLHEYINAPFNELSGGLKQRAMIARAMMNEPKILILDEPTAGVDTDSKVQFLEIINQMNLKNKITIIIVTHEIDLINEILHIDKVYKMEEGRLIRVTV
ncbi:MAG: ATP-binding cassette domain-containing protein [Tissierellia bacterium]|nr:ATP-binding cassette domain-containing protein [Tissierellia bacterium]